MPGFFYKLKRIKNDIITIINKRYQCQPIVYIIFLEIEHEMEYYFFINSLHAKNYKSHQKNLYHYIDFMKNEIEKFLFINNTQLTPIECKYYYIDHDILILTETQNLHTNYKGQPLLATNHNFLNLYSLTSIPILQKIISELEEKYNIIL